MEDSETKCEIDHNAPPLQIVLSNNTLKLETLDDDDFCMENNFSSKTYLDQEFHHLDDDDHLFNPVIDIDQSYTVDPFDPFSHMIPSASVFDLYEFKPYDQENCISTSYAAAAAMQGGGFLSFPDRPTTDLFMMEIETALNVNCNIDIDTKPLRTNNLVPDESSSVTADNRSNKNRNHKNGNESESLPANNKPAAGRKKSKSAKGQWTNEEDRRGIECYIHN